MARYDTCPKCGGMKRSIASICKKCTIKRDPRVAWSLVDKSHPDGCWNWTGTITDQGYGRMRLNGRVVQATRVIWELVNGPVPTGLFICHHCDNRRCVNPDHLFLGTQDDNMKDMAAKGRSCRGTKHFGAKLTDEDIIIIRQRYRNGNITQKQLADEFKVDASNIRLIVTGKSWAWLKE